MSILKLADVVVPLQPQNVTTDIASVGAGVLPDRGSFSLSDPCFLGQASCALVCLYGRDLNNKTAVLCCFRVGTCVTISDSDHHTDDAKFAMHHEKDE